MRGIVAAGAYVPYWRLERKTIADALGAPAGGGMRAVASYDEDPVSLAVEAARHTLRGVRVRPEVLYFATSDPPYLDKTNATVIHAALDLSPSAMAIDVVGSARGAAGALRAALDARAPALALAADIRTGLSGGSDEREGGDAASALFLADDGAEARVLAEPVASASRTAEFLDRWRVPGEPASRQWEERFGEHAYTPLGDAALTEALKSAGVTASSLDRLIVAGPHGRAVKRVAAGAGVRKEALGDDLTSAIGNTGAAHAGLLLAAALDAAKPDELIAVVSLADGADVVVWRTTGAITARRPVPSVATQLAAAAGRVGYPTFLTWRGFLRREPPRRPDPQPPEAPAALRGEAWKYTFTGSRCGACATRHLPPQRVCVKCHAIDRMTDEPMADAPARIVTFTVDRLAFSPSPPMVVAVLDFEGGGRFPCEMTDVDPKSVAIGNRVEMTFRRLMTANGIHNYFWKARPI
ncbi:MAG: OB-fold domain-containing protein, partial [Candidatus Rokubacteria bacterium]|nr:OB-fold domain-containing protein [Candidatus Rokubacteria bacterium]